MKHYAGTGLILSAGPRDAARGVGLIARFRAERDPALRELAPRGAALRAEVANETAAGNFACAELEELEQEPHKLATWRCKTPERATFGAPGAPNYPSSLSGVI